ncbi:MAG: Xaa-Pro aminopeptidase, partial [Actinomycetota bacterium]|nr:Xaa-Pro aminopeptidase [Actinomycetota bacterium]
TIESGMLFQCDIIPSPLPAGYALNCEDTIAVADQGLRAEIASGYPDVWRRITKRQSFMRDELGHEIADEILPLSTSPAYLAPFWLDGSLVCTVNDG